MFPTLSGAKRRLLDFVYPPHCAHCHRYGKWLCDDCAAELPAKRQFWPCLVCGKAKSQHAVCSSCQQHSALQGVFILGRYDGILKQTLHQLKYDFVTALAPILATALADRLKLDPLFHKLLQSHPLLLSVPLHQERLKWRGFNQSELLATCLCALLTELPLAHGLTRTRPTETQMELERQHRFGNVNNAFDYHGEPLGGKNILLLDDVSTTGATLMTCAKVLKTAGAESVWGIVLAHGEP